MECLICLNDIEYNSEISIDKLYKDNIINNNDMTIVGKSNITDEQPVEVPKLCIDTLSEKSRSSFLEITNNNNNSIINSNIWICINCNVSFHDFCLSKWLIINNNMGKSNNGSVLISDTYLCPHCYAVIADTELKYINIINIEKSKSDSNSSGSVTDIYIRNNCLFLFWSILILFVILLSLY
tara:strand:- start:633 stop:1178 length:546 start_codon:yes stop_codon:yes gene_type:complete